MLNEYEIHLPTDGHANPNGVMCKPKNIICSYTSKDAVPFVYANGRVHIFPLDGITHHQICVYFHIDEANTPRVHGRFWTSQKVISFWAAANASILHLPSSNELSDIVDKVKSSKYGYDLSDYTLFFSPLGGSIFVEIPVEEYIDSRMTGKENIVYWMDKFRTSLIQKPTQKTVVNKQMQRQWSDDERSGADKLHSYEIESPYADPMYKNIMKVAEGKIRLTESDIRKIVKEVIKKLL